jgi:hypothetical protein
MADLSSMVSGAFDIVANLVPGTVLSCTWTKVTGSIYNPALGTSIETVVTEEFIAIRSNYSAYQFQNGIQAGDVPIFVDATSISAMPPVGAVISWDGKDWEVQSCKNSAELLYELQMREKG